MYPLKTAPWIASRSLTCLLLLAAAFPAVADCEKEKTTGDAILCLERKIEALKAVQSTSTARLAQIGSADTQVNSGQPIAPIRANMVASCPAGQVVKAIKLHVGGTCNNQCDNDGRPVSQLELICTKQ